MADAKDEFLLVTGGAGFVGSHVVGELTARGHRVVVVDNLRTGHRAAVPEEVEFHRLDLADLASLEALLRTRRFTGILHFAALSLVGESMTDPMLYLGDNTLSAVNLLKAASKSGVKRFVLSSTANLFDQAGDRPINEATPIEPGSPYGESKFFIERMLHWADRTLGIRSACLRYFNAAGADPSGKNGEDHKPETHLIPLVIQAALGRRANITVFGDDYPTPDGTCIRDYIHILDLADAHIQVLDTLNTRSVRYNLGTGKGNSVREVIRAVEEVGGRKVPVVQGARRAGDPAVLVADPTAIKRDLGWNPRYGELRTIVEHAWRWHESHPNGHSG